MTVVVREVVKKCKSGHSISCGWVDGDGDGGYGYAEVSYDDGGKSRSTGAGNPLLPLANSTAAAVIPGHVLPYPLNQSP